MDKELDAITDVAEELGFVAVSDLAQQQARHPLLLCHDYIAIDRRHRYSDDVGACAARAMTPPVGQPL